MTTTNTVTINKTSGFTLVEVFLALGILSLMAVSTLPILEEVRRVAVSPGPPDLSELVNSASLIMEGKEDSLHPDVSVQVLSTKEAEHSWVIIRGEKGVVLKWQSPKPSHVQAQPRESGR